MSRAGRDTYVALGVDIAEARKGLDIVGLDRERRVVGTKGRATVADVVVAANDLQAAIVCIDSPSGWALSGKSRAAERELRNLGLQAFATPTDPGDHPFYRWMRVGFSVYDALSDRYPRFDCATVRGTAAEVFPHATAALLAGRLSAADESKQEFRCGVLEGHGIDSAPLPSLDRVDAALAALTGLLALEGCWTAIGDPAEGVILLPVTELPTQLTRRTSSRDDPLSPRPARSTTNRWCECGCGAAVLKRFRPGHDAKLKSRLKRACGCGDSAACEQLRQLGWL